MQSDKPFTEALAGLMEERGFSLREVSRRCQEREDGWGSRMTIARYLSGDAKPTMKAMEIIAGVFAISPGYFPEYRLRIARAQLDPEEVGLRVALSNLDRFYSRD
jgi:transcriptional regulator with XRE-family HTH domain